MCVVIGFVRSLFSSFAGSLFIYVFVYSVRGVF